MTHDHHPLTADEALAQRLSPLAAEADALLAEIDFEALAMSATPPATADPAAPVLLLPGLDAGLAPQPSRPSSTGERLDEPRADEPRSDERRPADRRGGWWMAAAAAVLLGLSVLTLLGARDEPVAAVAGASASNATAHRLEIVVANVDTRRGAERRHALELLRPVHEQLAVCVADIERAAVLDVRVHLPHQGSSAASISSRGHALDDHRRACLAQVFSGWDATTLGPGVVDLELRVGVDPGPALTNTQPSN